MASKQVVDWSNRIVNYTVKRADQFVFNPSNPRSHPEKQRQAVRGSLDTLGWIAPVIENVVTGYLVDGHERVWQALDIGDDTPVPCIQVELQPEEEAQALATFDFITYMATYDRDILDNLLREVNTDNTNIQALIGELADFSGLYESDSVSDNPYTQKIEVPVYEPSESKPTASELYDDTRTRKLIADIEASAVLTDGEKTFLKIAAQRHTVLNFSKIADYYAHSSQAVQSLMEDSALVIIDYNKAIELGFVKLTRQIAELATDDYDG